MTGILPASDKIRGIYAKSLYQAGNIRVRIGHYPQNLPAYSKGKTLVMLGACNPGGRIRPKGWNKRMMRQLRRCLSRYEYVEGKGSLNGVSEPLFLVTMDPRKALVLARRFSQNAIVVIRERRRSYLVYLT